MDSISWVMENRIIAMLSLVLSIMQLICFFYLYLSKNGADERGRGIFATASFIALVTFLILVNLFGGMISFFPPTLSIFSVAHILTAFFNIVLLAHIVSTLILRKLR